MKATGIVRRIDDLGRIVIPKEIRERIFGTRNCEGKPMELFMDGDSIVLRKYEDAEMRKEKEIRAKAIDEVFDFLKTQRDKKSMKVNFDDLEIRKYKEQLKGNEFFNFDSPVVRVDEKSYNKAIDECIKVIEETVWKDTDMLVESIRELKGGAE